MINRIFFILCLLLFQQLTFAQQATEEVTVEEKYTDTTYTEEVDDNEDYNVTTATDDAEVEDTVLYFSNNVHLRSDSVGYLRNRKGFEWIYSLDSLLKDKKKKDEAKNKHDGNLPNIKLPEGGSSSIERFFNATGTKIFLYSLAAIFVAFILYKLFLSNGIFTKEAKNLVTVAAQNEVDVDLSNDYELLAQREKQTGNFKLATRYLFLNALKQLAQKQQIIFAVDKTNSKYLYEIQDRLRPSFSKICLYYEYIWYGENDVAPHHFEIVDEAFKNFKQQL
jgi:hypothetical protein